MTILVTGATGAVGREVVAQLAASGAAVRALTRDPARAEVPAGVEVVAGDLTAPETLTAAFEGVEAVHLITFGGDEGEALTTGAEIVRIATEAGVRRVSVLGGWEESSVEEALRASSLGWTWLRPVEFMNGALEWADAVRGDGVLRQLGNWPSAVVHEADIAAVAVVALTEDGHADQTYLLTGPEALTPEERARLIGVAIGREVGFEQLTEDQERERLRSFGYPEDYVEFGVALASDPPAIGATVDRTVEKVTGRSGRTFAEWAAENAAAFR